MKANPLATALYVVASVAALVAPSAGAQSRTDPRVMPPIEKKDMPKSEGFDSLDTNRDGYLQKDELAVDAPRQRDFEKIDADGDHRLSREEWLNGKE